MAGDPVEDLLESAGLARLVDVFDDEDWDNLQILKEHFSNFGDGVMDSLERLGHTLTHAEEQTLRQKLGLATVDDTVATPLAAEVVSLLQACGLEKHGPKFHEEGFDDVGVITMYIDDVLNEIEMLPEEQARLRSQLGPPVPATAVWSEPEPQPQPMMQQPALGFAGSLPQPGWSVPVQQPAPAPQLTTGIQLDPQPAVAPMRPLGQWLNSFPTWALLLGYADSGL